jgi:hypothetical protein
VRLVICLNASKLITKQDAFNKMAQIASARIVEMMSGPDLK